MIDAGYFVEGGDCLANRLGISDATELQTKEYEISAAKTLDILSIKPPAKLDFAYLLELHAYLFGDIYDFAGKVRTVNIAKPDSPVPFCYADFILPEAGRIFSELKNCQYFTELECEQFIAKLAWLSSELNALHPFREGNGRTIRLFLNRLCINAGFVIDFALAPRDEILTADRAAFAGDTTPLLALYTKIVQKI